MEWDDGIKLFLVTVKESVHDFSWSFWASLLERQSVDIWNFSRKNLSESDTHVYLFEYVSGLKSKLPNGCGLVCSNS